MRGRHDPLLTRMDEPVTIKRLVAASGQSADDVRAALVKFPQREDDDEGRITGLFTRSPHWSVAFTFDGKTLFGCASDTLAFPVILGRAGVAEDTCPATGKLPAEVCGLGHFFSSPEAAGGAIELGWVTPAA